jgi:RimJ/RimL family protein N-acetyltransferase
MTTGELRLPIRTDRLTLRALSREDRDNHARLTSNPDVVRYLYEDVLDAEESLTHLEKRIPAELPGEREWLNLAVEIDGRYLGEVGVYLGSIENGQCEIGYVFLPEASGHGYATEATAAMVNFAFDQLGAHRVAGRLDARNTASARLLSRLGFRLEGTFRENEFVKGEWTDETIYAITEAEWRETKGA